VLSGIERVLGSGFGDSFALHLGTGFSLDAGGGSDTVSIASASGPIDAGQLAGVLSHTEVIDFTAGGVTANLTVDDAFIQSIVGAGSASHLTLTVGGDDTVSIAGSAHYTSVTAGSTTDYTFYADAGLTTETAHLTVGS